MRTVVLQSHAPDPPAWLRACLASVARWAAARGYERRTEGDELFARVPAALRARLVERPMIAADLARLAWIQELHEEGARAVWLDADVLVLAPGSFALPDEPFVLGGETWVQRDDAGRFRAYRRVHNALIAARPGEPVTPFLRWGALRLLERWQGTPPPHAVGPRLLGALHNLFAFTLAEDCGSLSPHVLRDLLQGGGAALDLYRQQAPAALSAVNLCASLQRAGYEGVALDDAEMARVCGRLAEDEGDALAPC